jgi:hypothetical protein
VGVLLAKLLYPMDVDRLDGGLRYSLLQLIVQYHVGMGIHDEDGISHARARRGRAPAAFYPHRGTLLL